MQATIRLPAASPRLYLSWVAWWREIERFEAGLAREAVAGIGAGPTEPTIERVVPIYIRLIEVQARDAERKGRAETTPELTGDPELFLRSLDYSTRRGEWLIGLARAGLSVPRFPSEVVPLREKVVATIQQAANAPSFVGTPADLVEGEAPGTFSLIGEIDISNFEQLGSRLEVELAAGGSLTLDLAGVSFMDSQGLRMLISLGRRAREREAGDVVVLDPSEAVNRVLAVAVPEGIPGVDVRFTSAS